MVGASRSRAFVLRDSIFSVVLHRLTRRGVIWLNARVLLTSNLKESVDGPLSFVCPALVQHPPYMRSQLSEEGTL